MSTPLTPTPLELTTRPVIAPAETSDPKRRRVGGTERSRWNLRGGTGVTGERREGEVLWRQDFAAALPAQTRCHDSVGEGGLTAGAPEGAPRVWIHDLDDHPSHGWREGCPAGGGESPRGRRKAPPGPAQGLPGSNRLPPAGSWHRACPLRRSVLQDVFEPEASAPPDLAGWNRRAPQRFLLYSHDSWGLGHLRRSLTLAAGLVETFPAAEILLLTGSPCATLFPTPPRVGLVKMPSVSKGTSGEYVPRSLAGTIASTMQLRRNLILEAYRSFRPTLVLVDHKLIGLQGEAYEMLRAARADGVQTVLGIRDVIDSPGAVAVEWGGEKCRWALSEG